MAPPRLAPFRAGTRRHFWPVQSFAGNTSATAAQKVNPIRLPNIGFLAAIYLIVKTGAVTIPAAGVTLHPTNGLAGLFSSIIVDANLGMSEIVNATGRGVDVASRQSGVGGTFGPRGTVSALTAGAQTFDYALRVPINGNTGRNFESGLILLQDPQINCFLKLQLDALNNVLVPVNGAQTNAGITYTVDVYMEYYEVPDPQRFAMPMKSVVRTLEDTAQALIVGDNVYQIPRQGTILTYAQIIMLNSIAATNDKLDGFKLRFNKSTIVNDMSPELVQLQATYGYGLLANGVPGNATAFAGEPIRGIGPGVYDFNWWYADSVPGEGDSRDMVDSEEITTTEMLTDIASGATVVSTDTIRHVRRLIQVFG